MRSLLVHQLPGSGYVFKARLFGVDVLFHWTFPLVGVLSGLIVRNLVSRPGDGLALDVFLACALSSFTLVALHEFGHAAVHKLVGSEVHGIIFSGKGGWCVGAAPSSRRALAFVLAGGWIGQLVAFLVAVVLVQYRGMPVSSCGKGVFVIFTGFNAFMFLMSAFPHGTSDGAQLAALWSLNFRYGHGPTATFTILPTAADKAD